MDDNDDKIFKSGDRVYGNTLIPENILSIREKFDEENKTLECRIVTNENGVFNYRIQGFLDNDELICSKREELREVLLSGVIFHYRQKIRLDAK